MFVKLQDDSFFNFEYVVKMYIVDTSERIYLIRCNMIDGKYVDVFQTTESLEEAKKELKRLIKEANRDRIVVGRS